MKKSTQILAFLLSWDTLMMFEGSEHLEMCSWAEQVLQNERFSFNWTMNNSLHSAV